MARSDSENVDLDKILKKDSHTARHTMRHIGRQVDSTETDSQTHNQKEREKQIARHTKTDSPIEKRERERGERETENILISLNKCTCRNMHYT